MSRFRHIALLLLATVALGAVLAAPASAAVKVDSVERQQVRLINRFRQEHGLRRLKIDRRLTRTAQWMAIDMPTYDYFAHVDHLDRDPFARLSDFKYPSDTWRGENLAAGNDDAEATFDQWVNSPHHRDNMLTSEYRAIGIARVCVPGSTYSCYWVTEFGSRVVKRIR